MSRFAWLGIAVLALSWGCKHTDKRDPHEAVAETGPEPEKKKAPAVVNVPVPKSESGVPLASGPAGLLVDGGVAELQRALEKAGFEVGESGKFDRKTTDAMRGFQAREELPRTGAPDRETLKKLGLDPDKLLKKGPTP